MSRRKLAIGIILILGLLVPLFDVPDVGGLTLFPQDQTIEIVDTHDDRWITETGSHFDSPLVQILDPNVDITSYLIFRGVEINFWEPLSPGNATLRLRTTSNQSFDDSAVTIYGMKVDELQTISVGQSFVLSVPYTTAHVDYNTSLFTGAKWHEIDVTAIVEELIRSHNWDGDGIAGTETGDAIGFVILGAKGSDARWFEDYRSNPDNSAELRIQWNHRPPLNDPPSDDPEWIEQYRNYTIWRELPTWAYPTLEPVEYVFTEGTASPWDLMYDNIAGVGPISLEQDNNDDHYKSPNQRKLIRTGNGSLYTAYTQGSVDPLINVSRSNDDGLTWPPAWERTISTYPGMGNEPQGYPSITFDSNNTIYVAWQGEATGFLAGPQIWIANCTISDGWGIPVRISTLPTMNTNIQRYPSIAVNSQDDVYAVWEGRLNGIASYQIWIANYTKIGGWGTPIRISTYAGMVDLLQSTPAIAFDGFDNIGVVFGGRADGFGVSQIWYANYTDPSWITPVRISTYAGMNTNTQSFPSIAVDPDHYPYAVWYGKATGYATEEIWCVNYTTSWGDPIRISTYPGMDGVGQYSPSIAIDERSDIHVVWMGLADGFMDNLKIFYTVFTDSWPTPICVQPIGKNQMSSIRWNRFPSDPINGSYFIIC